MTTSKTAAGTGPALAPAGRAPAARRAIWSMLRWACDIAVLVHVVFLLIFAAIGVSLMAWVNVGSIAMLLSSRVMLVQRRNGLALTLLGGEVVLHAAISSVVLGWDSGFHYYPLTLIAPMAVSITRAPRRNIARLVAFGLIYASLDAWSRRVAPVYAIDPALIDGFRYLNFAVMLAIMVFISLSYFRLVTAAESALRLLASTDPLTGLHNRRRLIDIVRDTRAAGDQVDGLFVLICDIDHFKHVNDRHGHETGDLVLQQVARALRATVRATDSVARWGGEEFVVLLPCTDAATALRIGERIRHAVAALCFEERLLSAPRQPAAALHVTITIGLARIEPEESLDTTIARADAALYRGKATGRNQVLAGGDLFSAVVEPA